MCTAFKDAKTKIKVTCNYFAQNPSLTSSWGILLDLIHYFISARSVSGLSQDQSGSGVPRDHSIHFTCQCQDFYTVWRIQQQQQHSKPGLWATFIFFLAGPAHWVQSSWDISNIGLTWYISFVSHTTQIWKQKYFDWYKNTIKDILHLVNEQDSQYFGKEKEEKGKGLMKLFTLKFYNKAKWLLKTRQNLWKNQTL